jgi:membrane-bound serine protease (ClpP class)
VSSGFLRAILVALAVASAFAAAALGADSGQQPRVLAVHMAADINPVTQEYLDQQIDRGEHEHDNAVVVLLDTPGGLSSSMRNIVKKFLSSTVPVIVYVSPPGSSADSAGSVITMAADVAAMAPQTNIGSSTPINLGGGNIGSDLRRKVINDAAAYVGELAREHHRNVPAARKMVTKASNWGTQSRPRCPRYSISSTAGRSFQRVSSCTRRTRRSSASTCRSGSGHGTCSSIRT